MTSLNVAVVNKVVVAIFFQMLYVFDTNEEQILTGLWKTLQCSKNVCLLT